MKVKLAVLFAVLMLSAAAVFYDSLHVPSPQDAAPASVQSPQVRAAPVLPFTTTDGAAHELRALPERGIILHFWASWCMPCMIEFPALLRRVAAAHGGLALVAVSIDDNRAAMDRFVARLKADEGARADDPHVYWVWDEGKAISLKTFDVARVPETVLIDRGRMMTDKFAGDPGWESAATLARLKKLDGRE